MIISFAIAIPAAVYFIFFGFEDGNNVSRHGHIALAIGVTFAFLSSFLFMGIIFFSSRSGADEQPNYVEIAARELECDESEKDLERKLKKVVKKKPNQNS